MTTKDEVVSYLKDHGYKMTMVSGMFQLWSHLEEKSVFLKSSETVKIYAEMSFEAFKERTCLTRKLKSQL